MIGNIREVLVLYFKNYFKKHFYTNLMWSNIMENTLKCTAC